MARIRKDLQGKNIIFIEKSAGITAAKVFSAVFDPTDNTVRILNLSDMTLSTKIYNTIDEVKKEFPENIWDCSETKDFVWKIRAEYYMNGTL